MKTYYPHQVLPHSSSMLLIDQILTWDDDHIETSAGEMNCDLFENVDGSISSLICMEYLCQSAAAHAGIRQLEQGKPVTIGFIIGARIMSIDEKAYRAGTTFHACIEQTFRDEEGIGVYDCALHHANRNKFGDGKVASAVIKAVMPDNPNDVIARSKINEQQRNSQTIL